MTTPALLSDEPLNKLFDADHYLHFHDAFMPPGRREFEARLLVDALGLDHSHTLLDLGCGHGRHSNLLARSVRAIVGIDRSERFLDLARREASEADLANVDYVEGDIRSISYEGVFDRALLVNTIFGLFSDVENSALLDRLSAAVKPGGLLCLDVVNRDTILSDLKPHNVTEFEGDYLIDRLSFDAQTGRMTNERVYLRRGISFPAAFSLRLYNYTELVALLNPSRFAVKQAFGSWNGEPFGPHAKKIIFIAERLA